MTARRGRVEAAVVRDLAQFPPELRRGALATACLALARRMDDSNLSDRDAATLARELRYLMAALPRPAVQRRDQVDEIKARREARRGV